MSEGIAVRCGRGGSEVMMKQREKKLEAEHSIRTNDGKNWRARPAGQLASQPAGNDQLTGLWLANRTGSTAVFLLRS